MAMILISAGTYAHSFNVKPSFDINDGDIKESPFFRKAGDKLFLNFFNREMGDVQIKVIDSENRILYSETIKSSLIVEKAFNFGKAEKDSYKIVVRDANDTFAEYYVVK
ncbi:hypothetical protein GCM10011361_08450 [Muriicola marianensis]|uniref:DUF3244 domain-containing protein n=2 Tax=Muriicola marianensis TaxID=1324801 RepID=A0ABQ1QV86_9FLAO|nr:hypothetical protein GCM10011361_08450 [Muriicola marianensis]